MRKLIIFTHHIECLKQKLSTFPIPIPYIQSSAENGVFSHNNIKNLLGQQFKYVVYDLSDRDGVNLNLENLAIAAGTIERGGALILICPRWSQIENIVDYDSLRWNHQPIQTPTFYTHFRQLILQFNFPIDPDINQLNFTRSNIDSAFHLTPEQKYIFSQLPITPTPIHIITGARGRGKSTLLGKLAQKISQHSTIILTAKSHFALAQIKRQHQTSITFISPDHLLEKVKNNQIAPDQWLFVDEAACLPNDILLTLCHYFSHTILTTTTENYEGTGQGFSLKLLPLLKEKYTHWQLHIPLRWQIDDPLEQFIQQLLLVEPSKIHSESIQNKMEIYQLLSQSHYKTTSNDLRRLLDGENQYIENINSPHHLQATLWGIAEGGLNSMLATAIWQGVKRPQGNLVAQYLCFQANLKSACLLRSLRISRIAVQANYQRQGLGKRLVTQFILRHQNNVDFYSVSFGLNAELCSFWQQCGFSLVQITPRKEASSGLYSAMMIYPISEAGKQLHHIATQQFQRDMLLLPFSTTIKKISDVQLTSSAQTDSLALCEQDWENLFGFAYFNRTLFACWASLTRAIYHFPSYFEQLNWIKTQSTFTLPMNKKQWITQAKAEVRLFLEKENYSYCLK